MKKFRTLFKILASVIIAFHVTLLLFVQNHEVIFSLFEYLHGTLLNIIFSITFLLLILAQIKKRLIIFQLFVIFIFVDTILQYGNNINFLLHVLFFVLLSRILFKILIISRKERSIHDHLIDS